MGKMKRIQRFGIIPYDSFKDKNRKIRQLQTEIKNGLRITIESTLIVYEYWDLQ